MKNKLSKSNRLIWLAQIILIMILGLPNYSYGQTDKSKLIASLASSGYNIDNFMTVKLLKESAHQFYYNFNQNFTYKIIVFSENPDVTDLDLVLMDNEDNMLTRDIHYYKQASVYFAPNTTNEYKIEVKNHSSISETKQYLCGIVVAYKKRK